MPGEEFIVLPDAAPITVALEPAHNAIHSLLLLIKGEDLSGLSDWVARTATLLTPEAKHTNELVMFGLHYAVVPQQSWPSFPAYLNHLTTCDPVLLRDKLMKTYSRFRPMENGEFHGLGPEPLPFDMDAALADVDSYLDFLRARFEPEIISEDLEAEAYTYVIDPPAMQDLIVSHLRLMWRDHLGPEWQRIAPILQDAVTAFRQVDFGGMSRLQAVEFVAGQAFQGTSCCEELIEHAERIIFVPNAHVGPYLGKFSAGSTLWMLFGARLPSGVQFYAPDLSRAEILVRLGALADDNRLRILKFISENGEQPSQDIISHLELSQSTVSRHLKQLCATGYLSERRCNGAKCYQLDSERIKDTLQAISTFLLGS